MKIDFITIFPDIFSSYINESILRRARSKGLVDMNVHDLRDYTDDKHHTVDDTPYGGGAGMVLKVEPIFKCVNAIKKNSELLISNDESNPKPQTPNPSLHRQIDRKNVQRDANVEQECFKQSDITTLTNRTIRTILLSAKGTKYTQRDAERLKEYDQLIFICGRYEGVDERVADYIADEEISIGDYVLTGGELGALVVADSVVRLLPDVLGNDDSAVYESHSTDGYREHPHYTKPEVYNEWHTPEILLSGDHAAIEKWRKENAKQK